LTQFNYARGYSEGLEFKAKYQNDGVTAYANVLTSRVKAIDVVSNQYLFDIQSNSLTSPIIIIS
jgi:hypothetical protein